MHHNHCESIVTRTRSTATKPTHPTPNPNPNEFANMLSIRSTVVVLCVGVILAVAAVPTANPVADATVDLVQSIDQLDQEQTVTLFGGLSVDRVSDAGAGARSGSESLLERVDRYLQSHTLNFSLKEDDAAVTGEWVVWGGGG